MKYKNKSQKDEYKTAFNQTNLGAIYEDAKERVAIHTEYAERQRAILKDCPTFENEEEAVRAALELPQEDLNRCRIWADVTKKEMKNNDLYLVSTSHWVVTYKPDALKAAEYLGMVVMYDKAELKK